MNIYDFNLTNRKGEEINLSIFKDKVILIVNTATGCGFTPQYEELEKMYEDFHDQGFEIIDVPCNQFANQAKEDDEAIHEFCTFKYKTKFDQFKKSDVNGPNALPLFTYLKETKPFSGGAKMKLLGKIAKAKGNDIRWNFTKFLVDKNGNVIKRFEPVDDMKKVREAIEEELNK